MIGSPAARFAEVRIVRINAVPRERVYGRSRISLRSPSPTANSLHYVDDQAAFIRACEPRMTTTRRFLIVEYDTDEASRWVPYPVGHTRLTALFTAAGYSSIRVLRSRPSVFRRAALYAAMVTA